MPTGKGSTYSDVPSDLQDTDSSAEGVLVETVVGVEPVVGLPAGTGELVSQAVHTVNSNSHNAPVTNQVPLRYVVRQR